MVGRIDERNEMRIATKDHHKNLLVAVFRRVRMRQDVNEVSARDGNDDLFKRYTTFSSKLRIL